MVVCVCVCVLSPSVCPTLWSPRMRYEDHTLGTFCPLFSGEPSSLGQPHPCALSPSPRCPQAMAMSTLSFAEYSLGRAQRSARPSSFTEQVQPGENSNSIIFSLQPLSQLPESPSVSFPLLTPVGTCPFLLQDPLKHL